MAELARRTAAATRSARWRRCSPLARRSPRACGWCYELRLHRARGYGALKAILGILAEDEPLTLTEIAQRLQRTPGLDEGLPLVARGRGSRQRAAKRYRSTIRCCGSGCGSTAGRCRRRDDEIVREVHRVRARRGCRRRSQPLALRPAGAEATTSDKTWGIIEID